MGFKQKTCWARLTGRAGKRGRRASALVIVLASLAFLAALALAFLASVGTELKSSKKYADGVSAQILSQSAFNLAIAQIVEGTRGTDNGGNVVAWASQPGMIRTYDTAGNKQAYYKLYSWDSLTGSGSFDPSASSEAVSPTWYNSPAAYVDLNEPLKLAGSTHYPIVEGNGLKAVAGLPAGAKGYDADNNSVADIDGFYVGGTAPVSGASGANPVPMPVKWLYVLEDGKLVAPSGGSGATATFSGPNAPSASNKIVGRVAFWADDESCKININVASEGTYWDTPRLGPVSFEDIKYQYAQPINQEYQRYPGHPAMTSLSSVLPLLDSNPALNAQKIDNLVPRIGTGGSMGNGDLGTVNTVQVGGTNMALDADRLYTSVEELIFRPDRTLSDTVLAPERLKQYEFFLTAASRAPELNLFNKPRVCIWPIHVQNSSNTRTAFDQLIAFCSTVGNFPFYFQRQNPDSATADLPGAGSTTGLGRNRMILEYLRTLTSSSIPGFGGSFSSKYNSPDAAGLLPAGTTERDQILAEIFDYIRCTNLADAKIPTANRYAQLGRVVPIVDGNKGTRGFGRERTLQGANLQFIGTADNTTNPYNASSNPTGVPAGQLRVQAMFIPQLFDVAAGAVFNTGDSNFSIEGLDKFQWGKNDGSALVSMGFPANFRVNITRQNITDANGLAYGDQLGVNVLYHSTAFSSLKSQTLDIPYNAGNNPSGEIKFSGGNQDVLFKFYDPSGTVVIQTVALRFPDQVFPAPNLADNPGTVQSTSTTYNLRTFDGRAAGKWNRNQNDARITAKDAIRSVTVASGDVRLIAARETTPPFGNPGYLFAPNPKYSSNTNADKLNGAHTLWAGNALPYPGTYVGKLVANASYNTSTKFGPNVGTSTFPAYSDVPFNGVAVGKNTAIAAGEVPGDWDNGVEEFRDGPNINKADEGDKGSSIVVPYRWKYQVGAQRLDASFFTPNRQIPSAVTFGSLPTGVLANKPWQTLLFRPGPAGHPGLGLPNPGQPPYTTPPDHLLLDLFHMPVVEPYAISEPLSTAGKINMNQQIVPFTYINRDTGLRAILKSERLLSVKTTQAAQYKTDGLTPTAGFARKGVNADATLAGLVRRFNTDKDLYRSASEICDIDIVPADYTGVVPPTRGSMDAYWSSRLLTGDNSRERIYATTYPRLTTKSNTFTVYVRAQSLQKNGSANPASWTEGTDTVTGEYRGYQTIERYADPNNPGFPDYANPATTTPISNFYKTRVLASKQFAP